jgi:hypothetical protein
MGVVVTLGNKQTTKPNNNNISPWILITKAYHSTKAHKPTTLNLPQQIPVNITNPWIL